MQWPGGGSSVSLVSVSLVSVSPGLGHLPAPTGAVPRPGMGGWVRQGYQSTSSACGCPAAKAEVGYTKIQQHVRFLAWFLGDIGYDIK